MTLPTQKPEAPPANGQRRESTAREVLLIVCTGVILASLDLFIVNVALPQIARQLHARNLSELSWVLNAYAIVYAALLVFFGRLADRYRRDRAFLLGVALFTAASAACAASTTIEMLVGFRVLQAAGAALLTPTSLGLVLASYPPERRQGAVRAWTAVGGLAAAIGPVVGGLLVAASWRWVFLVNVPIGLGALVVGWRRLPEVPGHPIERPDAIGVGLATAGIGLLTFGLVEGPDWGWRSAGVDWSLALSAVLVAGFVWHTLRGHSPLVRADLFRSRHFTASSIVAVFFSASFGAMLLSIVLWEQGPWGWSALRAGLAIAPGPLMVPVTAFGFTGRLIRRYGPAVVLILGSLISAAGRTWWALAVTSSPNYLHGIFVGMVLGGIGVGLILPTVMSTATASLPPEAYATGSAVINMLRQTGLALGVSVLIAVLGTGAAHSVLTLSEFQHGCWLMVGLSAICIIPAATMSRGRAVAAATPAVVALEEG